MNVRAHFPSLLGGSLFLFSLLGVTWNGWGRADLPHTQGQNRIEGKDHAVLRGYFSRFGEGKVNRPPDDQVRAVLSRSISEMDKDECSETTDQSEETLGKSTSGVRVLFVESGKEERPIRALLAYRCSHRQQDNSSRDERLASISIYEGSSNLAEIPVESTLEACQELVRIVPQKEVHIGGKNVVGLDFVTTNDVPYCVDSASSIREEKINFFLFDDREIRPAGSVLVSRDETPRNHDNDGVRTVYTAGLVFRKDMKGNIVGILAPFTVKTSNGRSDKGMLRFAWDGNRGAFVRERPYQSDSGQVVPLSPSTPETREQ